MAIDRWGRGATLAFVAVAMAGCDTLSLLLGFPEPVVAVHSALPVELAYREGRGGIVLLTGRVNGKADVDFVLDTGAPVTVLIDGARTAALALDSTRARKLGPADDPAVPVGALQPGTSLAFGDVDLSGLTAVVLPEAALACPERYRALDFAGVIGADLFRRFVVEVDPPARRVRLHDPARWRPPEGAAVVPLHFRDGHPFVEATLALPAGATLARRMHLDTGMNSALSLVAGSHEALPMPADGEASTSCFVGGLREVRTGPALAVDVGGARFDGVRPRFVRRGDAPRLQQDGAIGSELLASRRYAIDYPGRRLVLI
ncbi:MAG: hypothetical protein BroJett026_04990 [Betaproteobacteria bacterium]|nr:MAG: hypothetical protein BroJett026_04990 [Betaproteobacteria bacterium]